MISTMLFSGLHSQEHPTSKRDVKKEKRALKKLERKKELAQNFELLKAMAESKSFTLETTMIKGKYTAINVLGIDNFIKVQGNKIIVQTSNPSGLGSNGLGGITAKGLITYYDMSIDNQTINIIMRISSFELGEFTLNMYLNSNNNAVARLRGRKTTFIGNAKEVDDIEQFEGRRRF